ncbi:hypothetical protein B0H14DRAFT_2605063 [Mycena olivaceomarginata]|nr:hypothetical protein B0H14DRAFT_2605063 [Mycena olivaceomarginata]
MSRARPGPKARAWAWLWRAWASISSGPSPSPEVGPGLAQLGLRPWLESRKRGPGLRARLGPEEFKAQALGPLKPCSGPGSARACEGPAWTLKDHALDFPEQRKMTMFHALELSGNQLLKTYQQHMALMQGGQQGAGDRDGKDRCGRGECPVARLPTGGATRVGGEVPQWYLWARALHWPRRSWYECEFDDLAIFTLQTDAVMYNRGKRREAVESSEKGLAVDVHSARWSQQMVKQSAISQATWGCLDLAASSSIRLISGSIWLPSVFTGPQTDSEQGGQLVSGQEPQAHDTLATGQALSSQLQLEAQAPLQTRAYCKHSMV